MFNAAEIDRVLAGAAERGEVSGVVAGAITRDGEVYQGAFGQRGADNPAPMTADTVFWIASMTKPLVSAATMQMVEQGKVGLDQDLGGILPLLANPKVIEGWNADDTPKLRPAKGPITTRQLLTHTAGLSYEFWNADIGRYQQHAGLPGIVTAQLRALETPLVADPGTRWEYGISIDMLGRLVETLSGQRLDEYLEQHIFAPLGMTETGFRLRPDQRDRTASMHARGEDDALTAIPFGAAENPEFHMGGGGLYSAAQDYLRFCRMILAGGSLDGVQVLRPETVELMSRNQMGDLNVTPLVAAMPTLTRDVEFFPGMAKKWGLGFMINTEGVPGRRGAGSLAWAGLGNTYFWIDPGAGIAGVMLTQMLPFGDPAVLRLLEGFEAAVYQATPQRKAA